VRKQQQQKNPEQNWKVSWMNPENLVRRRGGGTEKCLMKQPGLLSRVSDRHT
jgi:hypothetical protein